MMLDKRTLDMLLTLDDARLTLILKKIAGDAGIAPDTLSFTPEQLKGIRAALSTATDSDLERAGEIIKNYKNGKKG